MFNTEKLCREMALTGISNFEGPAEARYREASKQLKEKLDDMIEDNKEDIIAEIRDSIN